MEEIQMIQITEDIEKALAEMSAVELIKLFGKLEEVRFGIEDTFGTVVGGHVFQCNTHREIAPYVIDSEPMTRKEFFELHKLVKLELKSTYSLTIYICPPHNRKFGQTGPDGIIMIPDASVNDGE